MSKKEKSRKVSNGFIIGLIISVLFIILFTYILFYDASLPSYYPKKGQDRGLFIFFLIVASISAIISIMCIYEEYNMSDEEKEKANKALTKRLEEIQKQKSEVHINNISYIGGHHEVSTETTRLNSRLKIKDDCLIYYSMDEKLFSIPISKIKSVTYDKSEKITLSRAVALGFGSLIFKKKTYYLIIEYIAENGLQNSLIFSPKVKDNHFLNELNVVRNKYKVRTKKDKLKEKIETKGTEEKLSELKNLLNKRLISDEDYEEKKTEILNRL